ncbi:MAG TPA: hypothetical protein VFI79_17750 [Gemmatimonadales bacterium]|nr:hypothetical protein [Gemmatimonadales bacterium]
MSIRPAAVLFLAALIATCSNELEPTGAITVTLAKGAAWPDSLAVAAIAPLSVTATGPNQAVVTGVALTWGSTDSSVVTVTAAATPLQAVVTSRRPGSATIVVRVAQDGFAPVELRAPVVVRQRGADSLLTVTDTVTIGITHSAGLLDGASISWGSSDAAVVNVTAVPGDATQAMLIARTSGSAQVTATVESASGHSELQLPVVVRPLQIVQQPLGSWPASINLTASDTVAVAVLDALGQPRSGRRVTWQSTNEAAFSVDSQGVVLAKTLGGGELVASVGAAPFQVVELRAALQVRQKWSAVSAGSDHTCAITALDGTGYCWGSNAAGKLGLGFTEAALQSAARPRRVATSHTFTELKVGESHSCGREGALELLCWGSRDRGQLGDGKCSLTGMGSGAGCFPSSEFPVSIVSGGALGSGEVHIDQLVVGGTFSCIVNVNAGSGSFFSRKVRCWGTQDDNSRGIFFSDSAATATDLAPGLSASANVVEVAAGAAHLCTRTDDVFWVQCMGINDHAQLGDGTVGNDPLPPWEPKSFTIVGGDPVNPGGDGYPTSGLSLGGSHSCALDPSGVLCWGSNASGQVGSATPGDVVFPTRATVPGQVVSLANGGAHTCALTTTGDAWCWGSNSNGQLGRGTAGGTSATPGLVNGGLRFVSLSAGAAYTCGLTLDGSIYCWGANARGQLGDGTQTDRAAPVRVAESPQ